MYINNSYWLIDGFHIDILIGLKTTNLCTVGCRSVKDKSSCLLTVLNSLNYSSSWNWIFYPGSKNLKISPTWPLAFMKNVTGLMSLITMVPDGWCRGWMIDGLHGLPLEERLRTLEDGGHQCHRRDKIRQKQIFEFDDLQS